MQQPIRYRVLVAGQMHPNDQVQALAHARTILTGENAQAIQGKGPWGCEVPDKRIRILRYKGVEVALYFRRAITEVEPFPGDPPPLGQIKDPSDAWMRFELLGPSAKQVAALSTKQRLQLGSEVELLRLELAVKGQEYATLETEHFKTQQALAKLQERFEKLQVELKQLKALV